MTDTELQERAEWLYKEHGEKCIEFLDWELSPPSHKGGPLLQRFEKLGSDIDQVCQGFSMNWKRTIFHAALLAARAQAVDEYAMTGATGICSAHMRPNATCRTCNHAIIDGEERGAKEEREQCAELVEDAIKKYRELLRAYPGDHQLNNAILALKEVRNAIRNPKEISKMQPESDYSSYDDIEPPAGAIRNPPADAGKEQRDADAEDIIEPDCLYGDDNINKD